MCIWIILLVLQLLAVGCRMRHGHDGVLTLEWRRDRFVETCYSAVPHRVSSPSLSWSPASSPTQPPDWEAARSWYTSLSPRPSSCSSSETCTFSIGSNWRFTHRMNGHSSTLLSSPPSLEWSAVLKTYIAMEMSHTVSVSWQLCYIVSISLMNKRCLLLLL